MGRKVTAELTRNKFFEDMISGFRVVTSGKIDKHGEADRWVFATSVTDAQ
jgi:hypothetical protein